MWEFDFTSFMMGVCVVLVIIIVLGVGIEKRQNEIDSMCIQLGYHIQRFDYDADDGIHYCIRYGNEPAILRLDMQGGN